MCVFMYRLPHVKHRLSAELSILLRCFFGGAHPSVCILEYLDLASWGESVEGLAVYPPVNVVEGLLHPIFWDIRVMALGSCDEVLLVSWCCCRNAGVMFNLFGYWAAVVGQCCFRARNSLRKDCALWYGSAMGLTHPMSHQHIHLIWLLSSGLSTASCLYLGGL